MKYLQNRESFSFSTSSKAGLFSDDEDDGDGEGHHHTGVRLSGHYQNDYFEISLPPPPPPPPSTSPSTTKTDHVHDSNEDEFEFCFSFNSSSTIVNVPTTTPISANHPFHHDKPPMTASTLAASQLVNVVEEKHNHCQKINKSMNYTCVAKSGRCHQGVVTPYIFPPSRIRRFNQAQRGLENNRLDGIKKFMVELRSIKSMLRSSLKVKVNVNKKASIDRKQREYNGHITSKSNDNNDINVANTQSQRRNQVDNKSSTRGNFKGFNKMLDVIMKNIKTTQRSKQVDSKSCTVSSKSSPSHDPSVGNGGDERRNFKGFSKMLDVIMKNIKTTRRSKQVGSKSCPVSIKSSPSHDPGVGNGGDERRNSSYSRDRSIQAAIAHCKKSFGK